MGHKFRFKRFSIGDDRCAMKVGTDGVLLGAWAALPDKGRILDIGTGCGIIAIMAAQRTEQGQTMVDGVEIDGDSYLQALDNINSSPWSGRINLENCPVQEFTAIDGPYQHIISNPPYFRAALLSGHMQRDIARHDVSLTFEELLEAVERLLAQDGKFSVVIPYDRMSAFTDMARGYGLWLSRTCLVRPAPGHGYKRAMMEFTRGESVPQREELIIENGNRGDYSEQYRALTSKFYLKF